MRKYFLFSLLLAICLSTRGQEIVKEKLESHIGYLASDLLIGRKPGEKGDELTTNYILDHFRSMGLELLCENGLQYFDIVSDIKPGQKNSFAMGELKGELDKDFIPYSFSNNAELQTGVVFVGYGFDINEDSLKWNDYNNIDVTGKWTLILRGDPELDNLDSKYVQYSDERGKVTLAKDKGAAGVLFVTGVGMNGKDGLVSLSFDKSSANAGIPVINITREMCNKILAIKDTTSIGSYEKQLNKELKPNSFEINTIVKAQTDVVKEWKRTQNVVALLKGSDPMLSKEYIVIGAHSDHLGMGGVGSGSRVPDTTAVHNGADDNASGVSAVIELARAFSNAKEKPRRSIVFATFNAEEMGLLGSKYFVDNCPVDRSQIKAMLNMDMIGRLKEDSKNIMVGGAGTSLETEKILNKHLEGSGLSLSTTPEGYGPSDHASFYTYNIPVFFVSTGAHKDYHTPADDIDKINFEGIRLVSEYMYKVMSDVANRDSVLTFQEAGPKTRSKRGRQFKVVLGIIPDFANQDNKGLGIDGTRKDGPAYVAGMQKGDVIVAMDGKEVTNIYDYMFRLKKLEPGQTVVVDIMRNNEKIVLLLQL